jgi:stage III sporulation protein AG
MIIAVPTGSKTETEEQEEKTQEAPQTQSRDDYRQQMQEQLSVLLAQMDGAGKTSVMITFADEGYTHIDKNTSSDENKKEETTVVYDTGDEETPYVIQQEYPKVEGVVVVAEGGDSPQVEEKIRDAVMSLFDIEAHKVIVVKMSGQEE